MGWSQWAANHPLHWCGDALPAALGFFQPVQHRVNHFMARICPVNQLAIRIAAGQ
jgi:hypothetical protein